MLKRAIAMIGLAGIAMGAGAGLATAGRVPQQFDGGGDGGAASVNVDGQLRCNGGRHIRHASILNDSPLVFTEADGEVSLGVINFTVTSPSDLVDAGYNAETRLYNAADDGHWIELRFYLDGVLMNPNDSSSPLALASNDGRWESNSASACERAREGNHRIEAKAVLEDFYGTADLQGWLDDSVFEIDIYG